MRLRSLAFPAAVAAVALGGLVAPAQAAPVDEEPLVGVLLPEQVTVIDGKTKTVKAEVINAGPTAAKSVVVEFSGVDSSLGLKLPAGCDADSCEVGDLAAGARKVLSFTLAPTGDKIVQSFDVSVGKFVSTVAVARTTGGVDLELAPVGDFKAGRAESIDLPISVRNAGTEAVDSIGLLVLAEPGLTPFSEYRNCVSLDELGDIELAGFACKFDQEFAPDATFTVPAETPVQIKVAPDAGGPYTYTGAVVAIGVNDELTDALAAKKGPLLELDGLSKSADVMDGEAPEDINEEDNIASFGVTVGKSAADSAAVGGSFTGAVGDTKTVAVGVRNLGPTSTIPGTLEWMPSVRVTVPSGVRVTDVSADCIPAGAPDFDFELAGQADGNEYVCFPLAGIGRGEQVMFEFTGTITGESGPGSVVVDGGVQDTKKANDKAAFGLTLTPSGGAGGGLPVTGAPTGWVALGGALLLIVGAVAAFAFRRRRIVTTL